MFHAHRKGSAYRKQFRTDTCGVAFHGKHLRCSAVKTKINTRLTARQPYRLPFHFAYIYNMELLLAVKQRRHEVFY